MGLKGASSPFLVDPARRNRCALAALNTRHLLRKPVCGLKAPLGLSCPPGTAVLSGSLLVPKENKLRPAAARRNRRALAALNTRHLLRKPVCGLKAPLGLSCPPGTAVLSGSLLVPKENNPRPATAHRNRRALAALNTRHLLRKPVCGLKAPLGLSCPPGTAVLSGSLLVPKENNPRPATAHRNRRALAALNTRHLLRKPVCGLKAPLGLSCPPGTAVLSGSLLCGKREQSPPGEALSSKPETFIYLLFFRFHCSRRIHARMLR